MMTTAATTRRAATTTTITMMMIIVASEEPGLVGATVVEGSTKELDETPFEMADGDVNADCAAFVSVRFVSEDT